MLKLKLAAAFAFAGLLASTTLNASTITYTSAAGSDNDGPIRERGFYDISWTDQHRIDKSD